MTESPSSPLELKRLWRVLVRRRYGALAAGLGVLSLLVWGGMLWPATYETSSTVMIERSALIDPLIKGVGVASNMEERLRNLKNVITSRSLLQRVARKTGLVGAAGDNADEELIERLRKNVTVTVKGPQGAERETDVFTISYTGRDPKTAQDVVNTLIREYIEEHLTYRRADAFGAYEFIHAQLQEYKAKLEESDTAIREFRERNPKLIPHTESTLLGRVEAFQTGRIETDIKLKELLRKRDHLRKQLSGEREMTVAFVTREGVPQSRLAQLNSKLSALLTAYTEKYPEVIKLRAEIEELKRAGDAALTADGGAGSETAALNPLYQQLKEELAKTDAEVESLRARAAELSLQQQEAQGVLGRMPKEQEEWTKLQRDRNVYQKIYDDLLQKLENARVSRDLEHTDKAATFKVVDPAMLPKHPVSPNRAKLILLGLVFGAAAGLGAAFLLEKLDYSYKDEESIERELALPVIASIPRIVTAADERAERRLTTRVFAAAGAYLVLIGLVLAQELLYKFTGVKIVSF